MLVVTVEGTAHLDYDAPAGASVTDHGHLSLCDAAATVDPASCGTGLDIWSQDADNASTFNGTDAFAITRVVPVSAGSVTLYLNAEESTPGNFGIDGKVNATIMWIPDTGALSVVTI